MKSRGSAAYFQEGHRYRDYFLDTDLKDVEGVGSLVFSPYQRRHSYLLRRGLKAYRAALFFCQQAQKWNKAVAIESAMVELHFWWIMRCMADEGCGERCYQRLARRWEGTLNGYQGRISLAQEIKGHLHLGLLWLYSQDKEKAYQIYQYAWDLGGGRGFGANEKSKLKELKEN